jgi:Yip1 domain
LGQQATVLADGRSKGFFGTLAGLWFAPGETFVSIVRRPAFWLPLLALVLSNVAFTAIWLNKIDLTEFVKAQMEESGQMEKIPADGRSQAVEQGAAITKVIAWVGAFVGAPLFVLVIAAVLYFIFRFFQASEVSFGQAMAIVSWSCLAVSIVTSPLTLLTLELKGDWNVPPQEALHANPTLLLDKAETPKPLWAFLSSLDLFSFWLIALLAIGFAVVSRRKTSSALWGVLVPWALVVCIKVLFAFF